MRHLLFITQVLNTATSHIIMSSLLAITYALNTANFLLVNFSHYNEQFVSYYICTKHSKFLISPLANAAISFHFYTNIEQTLLL